MDVTEAIEAISQQLLLISPSQWIQIFFLLAAGGIVVLYALPRSVRDKLMEYGARADSSTSGDKDKTKAESTATAKILDGLVSISQVPHSWFWHFYLLSVACSAFWAWQFFTQGDVMKWIAEKEASLTDGSIRLKDAGYATSLGRILVAWTMMAMQGSRRLYECGFVLKPGKSRMLVVHWALGLLFYAFISVAIWVENSASILDFWATETKATFASPRLVISIAGFLYGWINQYLCHKHLASLRKYTLPSEGLFKYFVCPHYTCECLIYLSMAVVSAPEGMLVSPTVLTGVLFVAANLGATAMGTKQWSMEKFGKEQVEKKWAMLPFIM